MNKNVISFGLLALISTSTYALARNSYKLGYCQGAIDVSNKVIETLNEEKKKLKETKKVSETPKGVRDRIDNLNRFEDREKALYVIEHLIRIGNIYGFATVADFVDLCDETSTYPEGKYGWTKEELRKFIIVSLVDGAYSICYSVPHKLDSQE